MECSMDFSRLYSDNFSDRNNLPTYTEINCQLFGNSLQTTVDKIHIQLFHPLDIKDICRVATLAILLNKYQKNLQNAENRFFKELKNGDLVYDTKKKDVLIYRYSSQEEIYFYPWGKDKNSTKFGVRKSRINDLLLLAGKNEKSKYSRNTNSYLDNYTQFIRAQLDENRILSTFNKRILIVTNLNWLDELEELHYLPIQVGNRERYLPIQPLVEVYNDIEIALEVARKNEGMYDLVYVGNNVDNVMNNAINYQGDGYINKLIFITSCNISKDYGFKKWAWTRAETVYLKETKLGDIENVKLSNDALLDLKNQLLKITDKWIIKGCNENELRGFTNWLLAGYSNHAFVQIEEVIRRQLAEINDNEGALVSILSEANLYDITTIRQELVTILLDFQFVSSKLGWLKKAINDEMFNQTFIVVPKWQTEPLKNHFGSNLRVTILTNGDLRKILRNKPNEYLNPDTGELFRRRRQIIIPHISIDYQHTDGPLRYYQWYQLARQMGHVKLLFYEGVEEGRAKLFEVLDEREHRFRMTYPDRQVFMPSWKFEWPKVEEEQTITQTEIEAILEEIPTEAENIETYQTKLNQYFSQYFGVWKNIKRLPKSLKISNEEGEAVELNQFKKIFSKSKYRLWFDEKEYEDWGENELIGKKTNGRWISILGAELTNNDTILDFNLTLDNAWEALKTIPEANESIKEVTWASREWREWLKHSFQNYLNRLKCTDEQALTTLSEKLNISVDRTSVKRWMNDKQTEYFFPRRIDDLDKVLDLRIRQTLPDKKSEMEAKAERIKASRGRSAGFREVITKLKIELNYWVLKKEKGDILSRLDEKLIPALVQTETSRRIIKIEKLDTTNDII